ncbi:hypothetical protein KSC_096590 [Ktedonobacter sp. SOSP1-52]|uniref:LUD domain-containing protein n=1 Tax=Ktedonobacter sp. SOSP1-52 TaxID=2778366 RepID=UPI0019167734|nr:LUD domain-containing protein [Ktedonobacter sp. SOSP1-52]GHO70767.1 hypothetical protein KSC_096590 [Ktedonobacter sp. SOSP1-52]
MTPNLSQSEFTQLASEKQIEKTVQALQAHGIQAVIFETGEEAQKYVLDLIPDGAAVYDSPDHQCRARARSYHDGPGQAAAWLLGDLVAEKEVEE